jgi:hypothetical protein
MTKPPDLNDMFLAGLSLQTAVALERDIEASPSVDPAAWWQVIWRLAAAQEAQSTYRASYQPGPCEKPKTLAH